MKKLVLLAIIPSLFFAQANYKIQKDVLSSGGARMTAGNFVLNGTISQTTIGSVTGGNYKGIIGFWQPFDWVNPRPPYIVKATKSGNNVILTWNKVVLDVNGYPEVIQYYSVYKDTLPNYTPGTGSFVGNSTGPDTTYTDAGSLNATRSYYYLVKAVDYGPNRSRNSNMGFKFNKFFNENAGPTSDRNWVSLPWHNNYTVVNDLANDLSAAGDPLVIITNMRNDQLYESYFWDIDFGWDGVNFNITPGRGYEMVSIKDTTLWLLGANNPNGLVAINENSGPMSDRNWVSIPYNAVYTTANDIATGYSPAGDPLIILTNMRNDQLYESYFWDIDFGWDGVNFNIEKGRAYEFVSIRDTTWNPTEFSNEGGPVLVASQARNEKVISLLGNQTEPDRAPVWIKTGQNYTSLDAINTRQPIIREYRDAGISHIVVFHLDVQGFENLTFTAYRLNHPTDVLTDKVIGCGIARKDDKGLLWFNAGNFKHPWKNGEEVMLIIEAVRKGRGYFATTRFNLDKGVDLQDLARTSPSAIVFVPIPEPKPKSALSAGQEWEPVDNQDVLGYSLYRDESRVNDAIITSNEYPIAQSVNLRPVLNGGYETVYGSIVAQNQVNLIQPIRYAFNIYPNPFIKRTQIDYALPAMKRIEIKIYDISGRLVKTLASGTAKAGYYQTTWSGLDDNGKSVASGVYFIRMKTGDFESQQKIILIQ